MSTNVIKVHVKTVEVVQTPEEATVAHVFQDSKERFARKVCAKTFLNLLPREKQTTILTVNCYVLIQIKSAFLHVVPLTFILFIYDT